MYLASCTAVYVPCESQVGRGSMCAGTAGCRPRAGHMSIDDDATATILRVAVADAMRELSPSHRQVLNETILRDRTVYQAAQVLEIPVGTVKSRVYYAMRALQVVLAERGLLP